MLTINAVRIANSFLWIFEVKLKLGRDAYRGSTEKSCIILRARKLPQWLIIFSHFCLSLSLSHLYLYPCVSPSCPSLLSISPSITSISPSFSLPPSALYICISPSLHLPFSSFLSLSLFPLLLSPSTTLSSSLPSVPPSCL